MWNRLNHNNCFLKNNFMLINIHSGIILSFVVNLAHKLQFSCWSQHLSLTSQNVTHLKVSFMSLKQQAHRLPWDYGKEGGRETDRSREDEPDDLISNDVLLITSSWTKWGFLGALFNTTTHPARKTRNYFAKRINFFLRSQHFSNQIFVF